MDIPEIVLAVLAVIAALAVAAAYYARGRGVETIKLLQANIGAYKDSERLKDARISYLEGQLITKDETIKRLLKK
jgi:hypothetical protein